MKKSFIIAIVCFLIDRIIKIIVISNMHLGESLKIIKNFLNITYVSNDGAAFSILSSKVLLLSIISLIVLFFIIKYIIKNDLKNIEYISYGLLIGGITGNLFDRLVYSSVIDYLDFKIFGYNFPIFNFADICIVISVGIILIDVVRCDLNGNKGRK